MIPIDVETQIHLESNVSGRSKGYCVIQDPVSHTIATQPTEAAPTLDEQRNRWNTGRRGVLASLKDDPFWPTRKPLRAAVSLATGSGPERPIPPGPIGLPVLGSVIPMARDPFKFFQECHRRYGDIYRVPLPVHALVMANHPDLTSYYMENTEQKYSMTGPIQGKLTQRLINKVGSPVQMLEGQRLRERRRMLMPMFGKKHLAYVADTFVESFIDRVDSWGRWADAGAEFDLQHELPNVTLPAFLKSMFSQSITDQEIREVDIDIRMAMRAIASGLFLMRPPGLLPLPGTENLPKSVARIMMLCHRLVRERRANPTDKPDLLNVLLDARYSDGSPLSDGDLVLELMGLIGGGYETVVASLSWTLALLLAQPDHLERLYSEIDDTLHGNAPTTDDLPKLKWARSCFDEGQRLQGGPINFRYALVDDEIGGYPIPKYTIVGTSLYVVHRDPRWWGANPEAYDPMQFHDEERVKNRPRLAFQAFGAGPHHCMGTGMAYMNAQFLLAIIFQRYRLRLRPGWTPQHRFTFSTTVKDGVPVTITRA
ncbi:MAG: cytochrome P450 [Mycolicibacterium sp.]|nr:MAG: cytochrome P450 [Mycolicibacterium sp.]